MSNFFKDKCSSVPVIFYFLFSISKGRPLGTDQKNIPKGSSDSIDKYANTAGPFEILLLFAPSFIYFYDTVKAACCQAKFLH